MGNIIAMKPKNIRRFLLTCIALLSIGANNLYAQDKLHSVTVYWDISMSMKNRDLNSDIDYLNKYFDEKNSTVHFVAFNTEIVQKATFQVKDGNWDGLKKEILNAVYDGTTSYDALFKDENTTEYLLFSDASEGIDGLVLPTDKKLKIVNSTSDSSRKFFNANIIYDNVYSLDGLPEQKATIDGKHSANKNITGIVSDQSGPLLGVNVILEGQGRGTTTNERGFYSLGAKKGDVLVYSFLGKKAIKVSVKDDNVIDVRMADASEGLDEVVITTKKDEAPEMLRTAYGEIDERKIGYEVASVDKSEFSKTATNVNQTVEGRLTGFGHRTDTDISKFTVRTLQTITGDTYGIVVIDGIPQAKADSTAPGTPGLTDRQAGGGGPNFSWLNPEDIIDITLLKSLAATNKYGSLGVNGVLEITTKNSLKLEGNENSGKIGTTATYSEDTKMIEGLPKTPYISALQRTTNVQDAYNVYLKQRDINEDNYEFYIDVYDYFKGWKNDKISKRILESALDINLDNIIALKTIAYKFQENGDHDMAVKIFKRIKKLAPKKSQSYRDLAQAYHYSGDHKTAFELYHNIMTNRNVGGTNFAGLRKTVENEYKNLISKHRSILDVSEVNPRYLDKSYMDYRVVFEWNDQEAEFDLQIVNPQKRFFIWSHTNAENSQRIKQEKVQGYNLEENFLTKDDQGEWIFNVKYLGNNIRSNQPVFLKMTFFQNYGKPNETKEIKVFRFKKLDENVTVTKINI